MFKVYQMVAKDVVFFCFMLEDLAQISPCEG